MTTAYSPLLGLALPVTGELAGTWGDTVNDYITSYLDSAVAGTQTISGSQTAVTLSKTTNAALSQAGTGSTGSSQYSVINCTGNPAGLLTITVPAASKTYVVVNATSTNQQVKVVGTGPTTGVTLDAGERAIIAWNGSDFIKVVSSAVDGVSTISFGSTGLTPSTATSGAVTVAGTLAAGSGGTGQSTYTTGDLLYATGATALSKLGIGTNGQILTSTGTAPQWSTLSGVAVTTFSAGTTGLTPSTATTGAVTLGGTLATTNGGTGLTSFTANRVFYASSTSAIAQSANLTFDGTTLTANNFTDSSLTSGRVTYAGAGGNLTDSANLTFDGTNFRASGQVEAGFGSTVANVLASANVSNGGAGFSQFLFGNNSTSTRGFLSYSHAAESILFGTSGSEQMRLTSTGLGIGTSSPATRVHAVGDNVAFRGQLSLQTATAANFAQMTFYDRTTLGAQIYQGYTGTAGVGDLNLLNVGAAGINFWTTNTQRMTLDSSGNLGLGVTPSAWSVLKALEIGAFKGAVYADNGSAASGLTNGAYYNSGWKYGVTSGSPQMRYEINGAGHSWHTAPSGTAGNAISFTQAMTLDASSRLALNGTDATVGGGQMVVNHGANNGLVVNQTGSGTGAQLYLRNAVDSTINGINFTNSGLRFYDIATATERARITSGGYFKASNAGSYVNSTGSYHELVSNEGSATAAVYIRNTNATSPAGIDLSYSAASPNGTGNTFLYCQDSTALRASIRSNGGIANYQANDVNLSDQRLKTDIQPSGSYLDKICAIPVKTFLYKDQTDTERNLGVMAQDVDAVAPEFIDHSGFGEAPEGESPYLAVYQTDLQYALMKCIQELKAQNDDLRARVAQLEAK